MQNLCYSERPRCSSATGYMLKMCCAFFCKVNKNSRIPVKHLIKCLPLYDTLKKMSQIAQKSLFTGSLLCCWKSNERYESGAGFRRQLLLCSSLLELELPLPPSPPHVHPQPLPTLSKGRGKTFRVPRLLSPPIDHRG